MAKVVAPLLSFSAGGQVAKSQVYASWKGIPYVRRYTKPANPQSTDQTKTRSVFATLCAVYKNLTSDSAAPWVAFATGKPLTDRNAFIGQNVKLMRAGTDWSAFLGSPSANGGVALASFSATGGAGTISTTVAAPTPPTGWSLTGVIATARINDDPHTTTDDAISTQAATATPWEPAFTGLAAGTYIVTAWPVWDIGGGKLAYGKSISHTATVT
jgi:hypothetical protein